ncbi:hypothetical protein DRO91_09515 [Candidatus Heimdallarchaeota archaeon]|nr:MAG: hypothetical protein DRO63_03900 [Candidatus Gerdarchaeota archaeon]RLI68053.1 MAG: hypothetical protein DRO91_09515 [Candidatus Heimdallarchaeota archaeon]RLI71165.1 MAG: hypothetical protein DRP02_05620 [Candidatus Gerdarchaeota archaeon]
MARTDQYKQIYQLWKNERRTTTLLEVKSSVFSTIRQLMTTLEKDLDKIDPQDKVSARVIKERISRLDRILHDLTKIRTHKIIHAIFTNTLNKKGLAAEELDLVNSLEKIFDEHNKRSILGEVTKSFLPETQQKGGITQEKQATDFMTVRILEDLPEIVDAASNGGEVRSFGPFKKEDIVKLPLRYAKTLIMKNAADRIDLPDL